MLSCLRSAALLQLQAPRQSSITPARFFTRTATATFQDQPLHINYEELAERGFTVIPKLLDASQLAMFEDEVSAFARSQCRRFDISPRHQAEPFVDVFQRGGRYTPLLYKMMEELFVLQQMSVSIGDRLRRSGFLSRTGISTPLIWPDLRVDPPNDEKLLLGMHQDIASTKCDRAWRLWIPLRRADEHHGTVRVVPGSHCLGLLPHDIAETRYSPRIAPHHWDHLDAEALRLPAGDAVLLDPLLVHESVPNRSDLTKFTLMIQIQDLAKCCDPDDPFDPMFRTIAMNDRIVRVRQRILGNASVRTKRGVIARWTVDNKVGMAGLSYQLRMLGGEDLEDVLRLHDQIYSDLSDRSVLYQRDHGHFHELLSGQGRMVGVMAGNELVAYGSVRLLTDSESPALLPSDIAKKEGRPMALLDGSAVRSDHRGQGLHRMVRACIKKTARELEAHGLIGIVSSQNHVALASNLSNGMQVRGMYNDDDGDNYLLFADLKAEAEMVAIRGSGRVVRLDDLAGHHRAQAAGLVGWRLNNKHKEQRLVYDQMVSLC